MSGRKIANGNESRPGLPCAGQKEKRAASFRRIGIVAIIYGIFGTLWILITDRLLLLFAHEPASITAFQTYKGLLFVFLSILFLSTVVYRELRQLRKAEKTIRDRSAALDRASREMPGAILETGCDGTISFASPAVKNIFGFIPSELIGRSLFLFIHPEDISSALLYFEENKNPESNAQSNGLFLRLRTVSGNYTGLNLTATSGSKEPPGGPSTVFWLTPPDQKDAGKPASPALDSLTGLYNWDAFEKELRRLEELEPDPGGEVIVCDIDGLSAINELGGTACGNLAIKIVADALKETLPSPSFLARIYSSGFAGIIAGPPGEDPDMLVKKLRKKIRDLEEEEKRRSSQGTGPDLPFPISVSFGRANAGETAGNLMLAFRIAENRMRREKLLSSKSGRSAVVDALLQALSVRDFITAGHAERLEKLVVAMGKEAGLPAQRLADLRLFASLHDLGKLGVPDAILFKPGPLSPAERSEIENHCEYGYRIAITIPELIPIADLILKHHERWDGKGYPLGLKEEEIPLECRILSIADAFDAMTASRPYRAPVTKEDALAELERCAGSQFDPQLVRIFIKIVKNMAY